jgi:preprotein translocase SecE subunit
MARDRKRSKQRQQRRARTHRSDDARATAEQAFGRTAEDAAPARNGDEQAREQPIPDRLAPRPEQPAPDHRAAEPEQPPAGDAAPEPDLSAEPDLVADPTADPAFAFATEPDFDEPVRPPFEESDYDKEDDESGDGAVVAGVRARPAPVRPAKGNRVTGFLRASWAELQRVQWPNRQQVFQATAVVLGFVVVAGAFLAAADFVAGKIVDAIL